MVNNKKCQCKPITILFYDFIVSLILQQQCHLTVNGVTMATSGGGHVMLFLVTVVKAQSVQQNAIIENH